MGEVRVYLNEDNFVYLSQDEVCLSEYGGTVTKCKMCFYPSEKWSLS
jgi:hypothetical protein